MVGVGDAAHDGADTLKKRPWFRTCIAPGDGGVALAFLIGFPGFEVFRFKVPSASPTEIPALVQLRFDYGSVSRSCVPQYEKRNGGNAGKPFCRGIRNQK